MPLIGTARPATFARADLCQVSASLLANLKIDNEADARLPIRMADNDVMGGWNGIQ